jgi:hypothetical protein
VSDLFPRSLREDVEQSVRFALSEVLTDADENVLRSRAENLIGIAEHYGIPVEELVSWIHYSHPHKTWSTAEFKRWSQKYDEVRAKLQSASSVAGGLVGLLDLATCGHCGTAVAVAEGDKHRCSMICTRCYGHEAQLVKGVWTCPACGVIG